MELRAGPKDAVELLWSARALPTIALIRSVSVCPPVAPGYWALSPRFIVTVVLNTPLAEVSRLAAYVLPDPAARLPNVERFVLIAVEPLELLPVSAAAPAGLPTCCRC